MKYYSIVTILLLFLLPGCGTTGTPVNPPAPQAATPLTQEETSSPDSDTIQLIQLDGIQFETSAEFIYDVRETAFLSFDAFADDMEKNLIQRLIETSDKTLTPPEVESELRRLEGHYSFERKNINGFDVLVHRRDFFGIIGNVYDAYVYFDSGKLLYLSGELHHDQLDAILASLKK